MQEVNQSADTVAQKDPLALFEVLSNYHKQEGVEELAYLTILFTLIAGIIGYLGSAENVRKKSRWVILVLYFGVHSAMVSSFLSSMEVHSALHVEIHHHVSTNPTLFYPIEEGLNDALLIHMHPQDIAYMRLAGYALLVLISLAILGFGKNSYFDKVVELFRGKTGNP